MQWFQSGNLVDNFEIESSLQVFLSKHFHFILCNIYAQNIDRTLNLDFSLFMFLTQLGPGNSCGDLGHFGRWKQRLTWTTWGPLNITTPPDTWPKSQNTFAASEPPLLSIMSVVSDSDSVTSDVWPGRDWCCVPCGQCDPSVHCDSAHLMPALHTGITSVITQHGHKWHN